MFETRSVSVPPIIRLKGQWLVSAGFTPGQQVEVIISGVAQLLVRQQPPQQNAAEVKARALAAFAAVGL